MICRILVVCCLAFPASPSLSARPSVGLFRGLSLAEAIKALSTSGLRIVFSSHVVRPDMKVREEPSADSPREILEELLSSHGLEAKDGPGGRLLVIRAPVEPPSQKATRRPAPPTGLLEVDFRRLGDHQALQPSGVLVRGLIVQASVSPRGSVIIPAVPVGIYNLEVFVPGFAGPSRQTLSVSAGEIVEIVLDVAELPGGPELGKKSLPPLTFVLTEGARFRETVEVSATSDRVNAGPTAISVDPTEVMALAGAGDNVFRALQTLPGVEAPNEFDSRIAVRGGSPDQNLTMVDGVEIFNPYYQLGLSGAFVPETVETFELSAGGFDARYGDRLSSLLVVESRHGSTNHRLRGSASMSVLDTNLVMEGKLPGVREGSWLVSGRASVYDVVGGNLIEYLPSFADLQTRVSWQPRPGARLSFVGILGRERGNHRKFDFSRENYVVRLQGKNNLASLSYESDLGSNASLRTVASFYRFVHGAMLDGTLTSDARDANGAHFADAAQVGVFFDRHVNACDWSLRQELTTQVSSRHLVETGFELHRLQTRWGLSVEGDRSSSDTNQSLPSHYGLPGKSLPSLLDSKRNHNRVGLWVQDRIQFSRISPELGVRVDHSGINGETTLSPRASISFDVGQATRLRAAAGVYVQSPGYEKLFQSSYFVDLSRGGHVGLENERSFHTVLAAEHDFSPAVMGRIEVYHKSFSNLIVGRLETEAERRDRVAAYDFDRFVDEVPTEPQITAFPINGASGNAYGVDLYITKKELSGKSRLTGWASYSYGVANRRAYGRTFPFDYDRRHSLSMVGRYRLSPSMEISATARIASGFPWTPPIGIQVAAEEDLGDRDGDGRLDEMVPVRDHQGQLVYTFDVGGPSNINSARLPVFARLDTRFTYRPHGSAGRWSLFVEILNVLNRDNAGYMQCGLGYNPYGERPLIVQERDFSVPLLPTFGVSVSF